MKTGILIDVVNETITEIEVGDYKDIQKKIGCSLFDTVQLDENNDIYVDDEGLLSVDKDSKFFGFKGLDSKFGGNGLVLGINHNNGESVSTTFSIELLKKVVKFYNFDQTVPYLIKIGLH
jgi:hypothetical protein